MGHSKNEDKTQSMFNQTCEAIMSKGIIEIECYSGGETAVGWDLQDLERVSLKYGTKDEL